MIFQAILNINTSRDKLVHRPGLSLIFLSALILVLVLSGCKKDSNGDDPSGGVHDPTPYVLDIPPGFPDMVIPLDNPMTEEGVLLGRMLFHDPILSADNTLSCASCHDQAFSFTDHGKRFSTGIDGNEGFRNAMSLLNIGWVPELNWDGSAKGLEEQAFEPVTNPIEMHETWPNAVSKLKADDAYSNLFEKAFGTKDFDSSHVVKALAQFERTLISSNSKWDQYLRGEVQLSLAESKGFEIFFTEKGDCFHCHSTILFTDNIFHNNGLDSIFADEGLFRVSGDPNDLGKFRTPTLRNVELTAPYMHDGRFVTLEEVIDFYSSGLKFSPTVDPLMKKINQGGIQLTDDEKASLIAFIRTLTDTTFVNNPDYGNITK